MFYRLVCIALIVAFAAKGEINYLYCSALFAFASVGENYINDFHKKNMAMFEIMQAVVKKLKETIEAKESINKQVNKSDGVERNSEPLN